MTLSLENASTILGLFYALTLSVLLLLTTMVLALRKPGPLVLPGLRRGELAPAFEATSYDGRVVRVPTQGKSTLLIFANAGCRTCYDLMPEINRFAHARAQEFETVIVAPGPLTKAKHLILEARPKPPVVVDPGLIAARYMVNASPSAVLIDQSGAIARGSGARGGAVSDLLGLLTLNGTA